MVALLGQDRLLHGAGAHIFHTALSQGLRLGRLRCLVLADGGRCGEHQLHVVLLAVGRGHLIRDVVDGRRKQIVVVDQHRSGEHYVELHGAAVKFVVGRCSQHIYALLSGFLDVAGFGSLVAVQTEVGVSAAGGVVAVRGNHILARVEQSLHLGSQRQLHAIAPGFAGRGHLGAVDIDVEHVVVAVHQHQVALQVLGSQLHCAAHIEVAVLLAPAGVDEAEPLRTEGALLLLPLRVVEVGLLPPVLLLLARYGGGPRSFVGHRHYRLQHGVVHAKEAVGLAVDTYEALQRLLVVGPVAGRAVGKVVIRRPD